MMEPEPAPNGLDLLKGLLLAIIMGLVFAIVAQHPVWTISSIAIVWYCWMTWNPPWWKR
jgi:hypothetical protein